MSLFFIFAKFSLSLSFFLLAFYQRRLWLWLSKKDRKIYTKRLESESESELGTSIWHLAPWHMHEMAITILYVLSMKKKKKRKERIKEIKLKRYSINQIHLPAYLPIKPFPHPQYTMHM